MVEITLSSGEKVNGKFLHAYNAFEGGKLYIFYVEGRGEIRCILVNSEYKELVI